MISKERLTHLKQLEAESMHIMKEVVAEFSNPAMLYSVGKDSSVMLHLLQKAFYPAPPPLPLVHVDTTWKFKEMIEFRASQSITRIDMPLVEYDAAFDVIKVNPLIKWSETDVWDYIKENRVPYNKLHNKGFPSIGCAPCTRAIKEGEDVRAGRWWWENPEHKECGLHKK